MVSFSLESGDKNGLPRSSTGQRETEEDQDDCASSNDRSSSNESGGNGNSAHTADSSTEVNSREIKDDLSRRETERILCLRCVFVTILVMVLFAMTATFYHVMRSAEIDEFDAEYEATADKIISALNGKEVQRFFDDSSRCKSFSSLMIHTPFSCLKMFLIG